jgi:hypothetical protein
MRMFTRHIVLIALVGTGCNLFREGRDILSGLTNPLVAQALVLGVELPDEAEDIPLPSEFTPGASATVFLADATSVTDLENAPVSDARVRFEDERLSETGPGTYVLAAGTMPYAPGQTWDFRASMDDRNAATAEVGLAASADIDLPSDLSAGQAFSIDLTGQDFDGAFVVVTDSTGAVTFDNRPTDIRGFYNLTRGQPAGIIDVPASALPTAGLYLIGVAGIESTTGRANMDRMNTALSTFMSGNLVFEPVVVD